MSTSDTSKGLTLSALQLVVGHRSLWWLVLGAATFLLVVAGLALIHHVAIPLWDAWTEMKVAEIRSRRTRGKR